MKKKIMIGLLVIIAILMAIEYNNAILENQINNNVATPSDLEPSTNTIQVTKVLYGEIWQVRCDTMDNTSFQAGGGYWQPDITNHKHETAKEGHRSNHCGSWENWVLFVNDQGVATGLYQLKSGSTGGTLPSIMYRAPARLANVPESQLIYDPTNPNDEMTQYLLDEVFIPSNVMPFSEIPLQEGKRLFWISQNGNQVWHHTGVLRKTNPRFAIVINGIPYSLGVGDVITINDVEEGLVQIEEIATTNYKLQNVNNDGNGHYTIINEIDDPGRPTPTPPPKITPTPTPTVTSSPTPTPTPTPSPTPSPSPTPTLSPNPTVTPTLSPTPTIIITPSPTPIITKIPDYTPTPTPIITKSPTPSPTITNTPTPTISQFTPTPIPTSTPTPVITNIPIITPIIAPTPTIINTPSPTPIETETPTPTPIITESPSPAPTVTLSPTPTPTPNPKLTPPPIPSVPEGYKKPKVPSGDFIEIDEYDTALGVNVMINHVGDCFD